MYDCNATVNPVITVRVSGPTGEHVWRFVAREGDDGTMRVLLSEEGLAAELGARHALATRTVGNALADMAQMHPPCLPAREEDGAALLGREEALTLLGMLYSPKAARILGELAAAFDAADVALGRWSTRAGHAPQSAPVPRALPVSTTEGRVGLPRTEIKAQWRDAVELAFAQANGNVAETTRLTGIPRRTLYRRLHELGLLTEGPSTQAPKRAPQPKPAPTAAPSKRAPAAVPKRAAGGKG